MTIMRVTLAGTRLAAAAKQALATRLVDAFATLEVGRSSPQIRAGFVGRASRPAWPRGATSVRGRRWASFALAWLAPALAWAGVEVVGVTPGLSALVAIDGRTPIEIEIGEEFDGVEVLEVSRRGARVRIDGVVRDLPLVASRGSAEAYGETITLHAERGQFAGDGAVNGSSVRLVVDTGATLTVFSRDQADAIGLDYEDGSPMLTNTVNGVVRGWGLRLDSVELDGVVVYDVDAVVVDNDGLPFVLLGMSYLDRFDMKRQGDTLVLRLRE